MLVGENAQVDTTGVGSVVVMDGVAEPVANIESVAVTVIEWLPGRVPMAAVTPVF